MNIFDILSLGSDAASTRKAMLMSYEKHVKLAAAGKTPTADMSPHQCGLYGELATRYMVRGDAPRWPEAFIWKELAPFLFMDEKEAPAVLAEYVVAQEDPEHCNTPWLRERLTRAVQKGLNEGANALEFWGLVGALDQPILWLDLVDRRVVEALKRKSRELEPSEEK